ncbi:MAG: type II secretion system protein GspM [Gammaproteobacteria bacterium]
MTPPVPVRQRALAAALLVTLLACAWVLLFQPWLLRFNTLRADLADAGFRLERYREAARQREELSAQLARVRADRTDQAVFVAGANPALAAAALQRHIRGLAQHHGAQIRSTQTLAPARVEGATRVTVKIALRTGMEALTRLLYAVETGTPYVIIQGLDIRGVVGAATPAAAAGGGTLDVEIEAGAFMSPQSGPSQDAPATQDDAA